MTQSRWLRRVGLLVALAAVYVIAGKLGLKLAFENASATPVWPCTGIALAAFVLLGYDVWPAVLAGSFLVNITTAGSVATALGIAAGNTLEGLAGAYLVNRFARGRRAFDRPQDVFAFTVLAGIVSTTVGATVGVTTLAFTRFARWAEYGAIWWTWWLGEAVGDLVVAPAVVLWAAAPRLRWNRAQWIEAGALLLWVVVVGFTVFGGLFPSRVKNYPLEFLCFPFLIWAAFRFAQREAASAVVVLSGIAIWGTLHGFGPFVRATRNESLLLLQAFMGVTSVMTLALAALVAERSQVEERLRQLAVSDPLTGLANYRQLTYAIDAEIKRFQRTERPFAVVLLDMDGLKKINDSHGHLVGSLALCRVAETLFGSCRAMATVARTPGSLTVGPLRPVILRLAVPAVAMMACHFSFNLIDSVWVGRLIGAAALAAVSTAGFYVWVLLSLGEMVEVGLIAVAARRHGGGRPGTGARAAGRAVLVGGGGFLIGAVIALRRGLIRLGAPDWRAVPTIFRVGAPLSLAGVLLSLIYMWLTRFTSRFGTPALAALGVGHKVEGIGFMAISGFALSASALVGQNLGARQEERARQAVRMTVGYCLLVTTATAVAFLTIPRVLVGLFTPDPAVITDGSLYLRVIALAQVGQTFEIILEGALAGAGYTFWPQIVSTGLTLLRLPLAAWWSATIGLLGIWLALSVTAIARGVAMAVFWASGAWRRATV